MKINEEKQILIDKKLDALLERLQTEPNLDLFSEVFDLFDDKFEQEYPEHYLGELNRVRDFYAIFETAYENGLRQGEIKKR